MIKPIFFMIVVLLFTAVSHVEGDQGNNLIEKMEKTGYGGRPGYPPISREDMYVVPAEPRASVRQPSRQNEQQSFPEIISYQQKHIELLTPDQRQRISVLYLGDSDAGSQQPEYAVRVGLISNFFALESYPEMESFFLKADKRGDFGEPLIRHIKYHDPLLYYVMSKKPSVDANFDMRANGSLVENVYEIEEGIRFFDKTSEIFIYRLARRKGLLVVRGTYVYLDEDVNGIPESIYMLQRYKNAKRKQLNYLQAVQKGETAIHGSSKEKFFSDSIATALNIIKTQYIAEQ
ncbi:MAG: hypothetical protein RBU23_10765 [Candidatus Auribacterota bacterium]|jgi:hypothetical protein|nr:hypothetical protein [Candidatus Auribacterota bacterium]